MFCKPKTSALDFMIVGLGNPGSEYEGSRHNAGFLVLDILCEKTGIVLNKEKFSARFGLGEIGGKRGILCKPQTFMNASGRAVRPLSDFYKLPPEKILVIYDDISLEPGHIRIRKSGSAGGHNGMKDLIACLQTQDFPRIRLGVGAKPHPDYDLADWVLSRFSPEIRPVFGAAAERAAEAAQVWVKNGTEAAMNRYNG